MYGRPIDPANPIDRQMIAGLPAHDRQLRHGEMLFGAFIAVRNSSTRPLRSADRIELRHDAGDLDRSLPLPASNSYAYAARVVGPGATVPGQDGPVADDLAAGSRLVLCRIRAREYNDGGTFELVIHDPLHPDRTASLVV